MSCDAGAIAPEFSRSSPSWQPSTVERMRSGELKIEISSRYQSQIELSYVNTLIAVRRTLRGPRSPLRRLTLAVDARLHVDLILWALRRERRWNRRRRSILRRASLRPLDVNHFAIAVIASDWVVAFVGVGTRVGAQGWSRDIPRPFVFHLEIIGKHRALVFESFSVRDVKQKLMKFRPLDFCSDDQGERVVGDTLEHDSMENNELRESKTDAELARARNSSRSEFNQQKINERSGRGDWNRGVGLMALQAHGCLGFVSITNCFGVRWTSQFGVLFIERIVQKVENYQRGGPWRNRLKIAWGHR